MKLKALFIAAAFPMLSCIEAPETAQHADIGGSETQQAKTGYFVRTGQ